MPFSSALHMQSNT